MPTVSTSVLVFASKWLFIALTLFFTYRLGPQAHHQIALAFASGVSLVGTLVIARSMRSRWGQVSAIAALLVVSHVLAVAYAALFAGWGGLVALIMFGSAILMLCFDRRTTRSMTHGHVLVVVLLFQSVLVNLVLGYTVTVGDTLLAVSHDMPGLLHASVPNGVLVLGEDLLRTASMAAGLCFLGVVLLVVRYLFTFFTTVSIVGVSVGAMALVIVLSVMNGFETDLRSKILGSNAHIRVTKSKAKGQSNTDKSFSEWREVVASLEKLEGVEALTPYLQGEVLLKLDRGGELVVVLKGVDPLTVSAVNRLESNIQVIDFDYVEPKSDDDDGLIFWRPHKYWRPVACDDGKFRWRRGPRPKTPLSSSQRLAVQHQTMQSLWPLGTEDLQILGATGESPSSGDKPAVNTPAAVDSSDGDQPPPDFYISDETPRDLSGDALQRRRRRSGDMDAPVVPSIPELRFHSPKNPPATGSEVDGPQPEDRFDGKILDAVPFDESSLATLVEQTEEKPISACAALSQYDRDMMSRPAPVMAGRPGILVGSELAKEQGVRPMDLIFVVSPRGTAGPTAAPATTGFRVAGTFYTGMYEYDNKLTYVELEFLQKLLGVEGQVDGIEIRVTDPDETVAIAARIRARLAGNGYRVQDWQSLNKNLFSALKLEKIAMFFVLAIIILVASFSIVGNLIMVVVEKGREIALLKTLGSSSREITMLFVAQGFFIGGVGTTIGVSLGLAASWAVDTFKLIPLPREVYYIDRLPISIDMSSVIAVGVAGLIISVLATIYPAWLATRLRPVEGLRHDS